MIGGKDDEGVISDPLFLQGIEKAAEACIERRAVGVVAREVVAGYFGRFQRHVGGELDFFGRKKRLILFGGGVVGVMRGTPGKKEGKRAGSMRAGGDFGAGQVGLSLGVISFPEKGFRGIGIVQGMVVVVGAFEAAPDPEAEAIFGRDVTGSSAAVEMPFADPKRIVIRGVEMVGQRAAGHMSERLIVDDDPVGKGVSAGEERGAVWAADRTTAHRVGKSDCLCGEGIGAGRFRIWISGVSEGLGAPLVGEDEEDMRATKCNMWHERILPKRGQRTEEKRRSKTCAGV